MFLIQLNITHYEAKTNCDCLQFTERKVLYLKSLSIAYTGISNENRTQTRGKIKGFTVLTYCVVWYITHRLIQQALYITAFNSQTCLIPRTQTFKTYFRFFCKNCPCCEEILKVAAWLTRRQSYCRVYGTLHQSEIRNRHMKQSAQYIHFVYEYAVHLIQIFFIVEA
jgi:alkyl hydroperoxide reductase subunit AhpF